MTAAAGLRRRTIDFVAGAAIVAAACGLTRETALAGTPYTIDREVDDVRGWTIATNAVRHGCFATASFQSKTVIEIGFDTRDDTSFLVFANESWDKIKVGNTYALQMVFNGHKSWNGTAVGVRIGKLYGLAFEGVKEGFVLDFAQYTTVQLNYRGSRLDGFNLAGTRAAVQAAIACAGDVGAGRIAAAEEERQSPTTPPSAPAREGADDKAAKKPGGLSTGTGFFVNDRGDLLTNAHVIESCDEAQVKLPDGRSAPASIVARSVQNDLAVLRAELKPTDVAKLRSGAQIRLGEQIVLFGYPLAGELTMTGNLATGLVSAMAGPGEDVTRMQISAPVQSGNSGGAVVDLSGHVVGVVVSKANTRPHGDGGTEVLQNVNFAIKTGIAGYFLEANQIPFTQEPAGADRSIADVAAVAKDFAALVICRSR